MIPRRPFGGLLRAAAGFLVAAATLAARDFHIDAANGNNANDGSLASPVRNVGVFSGPSKRFTLAAGDNVYFRGNAVHQQNVTGAFTIDQAGTASSPITVRSYPGESAVVDGSLTLYTQNTFELGTNARHVVIRDLEIRNSNMGAIGVAGAPSNLEFRNLKIHGSQWQAIHITPASTASYVTIDNVEAFNNARQNANADNTPRKHDAGWPSTLSLSGSHVTLTNCYIYENYGEGVGFYGNFQRIANCRVRDNFSVNIYVNNVANSVCENNFVTTTYKTNHYRRYNPNNPSGSAPAIGIEMASEGPYGFNNDYNRVINNIVFGGHSAFFYWAAQNLPLNHATIANNTFVGGLGTGNVVHLDGNSHTASLFANNIISQGPAAGLTNIGGTSGMTFDANLYHGTATRDPDGAGSNEVYGDPLLASVGSNSPDGYRLSSASSPAINRGASLAAVPADYFGSPRPYGGTYDIGAHEWSGASTPVAAAPVISPAGGNFTAAQSVSLSSATAGATLRYTTDGSTPSATTGTVYTGPFSLNSSATVRAVATASGYSVSNVSQAVFTLTLPAAAAPVFTPAAGVYNAAQSVTLSSATPDATIRYTIDGSTPTATTGTLYTGAFTVGSSATVRALASASGHGDSAVSSATYTINVPTAAAPQFSPAPGVYSSAQSVSLSSATAGATIRYTVDGTTPSASNGTVYSAPFAIGATTTVRAIAAAAGLADSPVAVGTYTINLPSAVQTPTFSPAPGSYTGTQSVTLSSTWGATIRYTIDGSTPTASNGTVYTGALSVPSTRTIKAYAFKAGLVDSAVATGTYTINAPAAATPSFNPPGGTYTTTRTVSLLSSWGATIRYTTDGSDPTPTSGTIYSAAIPVNSSQTVKAIAYGGGFAPSSIGSATYTINLPQAAAPTFSPAPGNFSGSRFVTLSSPTWGLSLRYTLDGSTPTPTTGLLYSGGFTLTATTTVRAIAYGTGYTPSPVATGTYTKTP